MMERGTSWMGGDLFKTAFSPRETVLGSSFYILFESSIFIPLQLHSGTSRYVAITSLSTLTPLPE